MLALGRDLVFTTGIAPAWGGNGGGKGGGIGACGGGIREAPAPGIWRRPWQRGHETICPASFGSLFIAMLQWGQEIMLDIGVARTMETLLARRNRHGLKSTCTKEEVNNYYCACRPTPHRGEEEAGCSMPSPKRRIKHAAIVDAFAERLRELRASRNMTQKELAGHAKITISYVSRLESGGAAPGLDLLERIATALGVSIPDLLPIKTDPEMEERRRQVKGRLESLVTKAGSQTLAMLDLVLTRLEDSPAVAR